MERASGALLWGRACVLAAVAVAAGVLGHVSADGLLPPWPVLVLLVGAAVPFCATQLTRPAGRLRVVALLVAGQTVVHVALSVAAGHRGDARATPAIPGTGTAVLPVHDGRRVGSLLDGYQAGPGHVAPAGEPTLPVGSLLAELGAHGPMMAAHLAAAVAVGLWLAGGERALWTLLALTARVVVPPVGLLGASPVPGPRPRPALAGAVPPARPRVLLLARDVVRRGPPALLAS